MAFEDVELATSLYPTKHGVSRIVIDPVAVVSNGTYEYRVKRARYERFAWTIPTQTMTQTQKVAMRQFLQQRNHGLNSFKFVDATQTRFVDAVMPSSTVRDSGAGSTSWDVFLPFDTSTYGTNHPLSNIDNTGWTVTLNGSPTSFGSFTAAGTPSTFTIAGSSPSDVVRVTGNITFTARLDGQFQAAMIGLDTNNEAVGHSVSALKFIEVYGES